MVCSGPWGHSYAHFLGRPQWNCSPSFPNMPSRTHWWPRRAHHTQQPQVWLTHMCTHIPAQVCTQTHMHTRRSHKDCVQACQDGGWGGQLSLFTWNNPGFSIQSPAKTYNLSVPGKPGHLVTLPKAEDSPITKALRAHWKIAKTSREILRSFLEGKTIMPRVPVTPGKCCSAVQPRLLRDQWCFLPLCFIFQSLPSLHPLPPGQHQETTCCLSLSSSFQPSTHLYFYPLGQGPGWDCDTLLHTCVEKCRWSSGVGCEWRWGWGCWEASRASVDRWERSGKNARHTWHL